MLRVLIIDDSISILALLQDTIAKAGYEAHTAKNAKEINESLNGNDFDLVITDIYMPEQDGLETILNLRITKPDIPIVAMSSNTGYSDVLDVAKKLGARKCLRKPFTQEAILDSLLETIGPGAPSNSAN
ncbi:response regulator [Pelagicoccus mobilis]|uniref:Response regulator n=1 Tax=Pelagicoccus mobilis TaxID=415221 RepID=A0A934VL79_9BACT|nr:response regulator [Pelagicoccus mobilis]MBK1877476.1 response regulator [Pelagicoccus mobilis]